MSDHSSFLSKSTALLCVTHGGYGDYKHPWSNSDAVTHMIPPITDPPTVKHTCNPRTREAEQNCRLEASFEPQ